MTDSKTNFVFVHHPKVDATTLFKALYEAKIIVRHWNQARISDWLRITIGTDREMNTVIQFLKEYLKTRRKVTDEKMNYLLPEESGEMTLSELRHFAR